MQCLTTVDPDRIRQLQASGEFFWLDLADPAPATVAALEAALPAAAGAPIEPDAQLRPRADRYDDHVALVMFGVQRAPDGREIELLGARIFVSGGCVVSVHRQAIPEFDEVRAEWPPPNEEAAVFQVVNAIVETFGTLLAEVDTEIDTLEDAVIAGPRPAQLHTISSLKHVLVEVRRVLAPQRDLFARAGDEISDLPGLQPSKYHDLRAIYDRLSRLAELADGYRDLLTGVMDIYLSTVSNRLNEIMRALTVVATIFLPLTLLTGFFGQNFPWLIGHIRGPTNFWVLGVGGLAASGLAIWAWLRWAAARTGRR